MGVYLDGFFIGSLCGEKSGKAFGRHGDGGVVGKGLFLFLDGGGVAVFGCFDRFELHQGCGELVEFFGDGVDAWCGGTVVVVAVGAGGGEQELAFVPGYLVSGGNGAAAGEVFGGPGFSAEPAVCFGAEQVKEV